MSRQEQKKAEARLIEAAGAGDAEGVKAALAAGARTEVSDASGRTPLLLASLGDHVAVARALVEAGADPDAQDDRDDSAWLVTGVTGSVEMMRTLLPAEPDQTLRNRFGGTALIPAAERGHVPYIRAALREASMEVDHVNGLGWTALLEAVILGDGERTTRRPSVCCSPPGPPRTSPTGTGSPRASTPSGAASTGWRSCCGRRRPRAEPSVSPCGRGGATVVSPGPPSPPPRPGARARPARRRPPACRARPGSLPAARWRGRPRRGSAASCRASSRRRTR